MSAPSQMDAFLTSWTHALRGMQACLVASYDAPQVRALVTDALSALREALDVAHALTLSNLETQGFHDLARPDPPSPLTPALRQALGLRIGAIITAPTRLDLIERLADEGASAIGLIGPGGVSARFVAHALARAAADCPLIGETPAARALRRVHPLTAKLIVLGALERASSSIHTEAS